MIDPLLVAWHFATTRWLWRRGNRERQQRRLRRFLRDAVRECPFYEGRRAELSAFPVMEKATFLEQFAALNRQRITLDEATAVALRAEQERDFRPVLRGGLTVGLSSGTSGVRHVFLVGRQDRCRWAGQILARTLSTGCLRQVLNPLAPPLRIAFFLRANSNLYTTFSNHRIRLEYYDLTRPFEALVERLASQRPQILVAPATVLAELARRVGDLRPEQIISVAEVLDTRDREEIERAYGVRVTEVYQAAEGFLGSTCEEGRMHLNEDSLHIEPHWMDESEDRFQPIITDFSRRTQWFVRYHLNDILRIRRDPCPCGDASLTLDSIEGRTDEILWARNDRGQWQPVFPDALRQALYAMKQPLDLYRIEQHGNRWEIQLRRSQASLEGSIRAALEGLLTGLGLGAPEIDFRPWVEQPTVEKQRRIRCLIRPT